MATTDFQDNITPIIAAWLNDVDEHVYNYLDSGGQKLQSFRIIIANNAGTIQHLIRAVGGAAAASYAGKVTGASSSFANTPSGTDTSTNFTSGLKISSTDKYRLILDTSAQTTTSSLLLASIGLNSTGTAATVNPVFISSDVNGTTRNRLAFEVYNSSSGAGIDLTALSSGTTININFLGFLL